MMKRTEGEGSDHSQDGRLEQGMSDQQAMCLAPELWTHAGQERDPATGSGQSNRTLSQHAYSLPSSIDAARSSALVIGEIDDWRAEREVTEERLLDESIDEQCRVWCSL